MPCHHSDWFLCGSDGQGPIWVGRCGFSKIPPGQGRNIRPGVPAAVPLEVRGKQGTLARHVAVSLEKVDLSHLTGGCWTEP